MNNLESCLFQLGVAVEKKAIRPKETAQFLLHLATMVHPWENIIDPKVDEELKPLNEQLGTRFGHLNIGK